MIPSIEEEKIFRFIELSLGHHKSINLPYFSPAKVFSSPSSACFLFSILFRLKPLITDYWLQNSSSTKDHSFFYRLFFVVLYERKKAYKTRKCCQFVRRRIVQYSRYFVSDACKLFRPSVLFKILHVQKFGSLKDMPQEHTTPPKAALEMNHSSKWPLWDKGQVLSVENKRVDLVPPSGKQPLPSQGTFLLWS